MTSNCKILIMLLLLTMGSYSCGLFSGESGDAEVIFAATEVGTPEGDKVTKDIGPAGGTLTSPDGRMTLTVPKGALTETLPFSMQPITNKAGNGLGLAYRLEPSGKTFTTPLEISVRYVEKDLEGTVPEVLALAYQDQQGAWHEMKTLNLTENTLTVATTHFSDWAFLAKMRLSPATATVVVGKRLSIALLGCAQPELTFWEKYYRGTGNRLNDPDMYCKFGTLTNVNYSWRVDIGTIENRQNPVWYTAPPQKPTPNVATVVFPYSAVDQRFSWNPRDWTGKPNMREGEFTAKITIIDRGYRATGHNGDIVFSGVICSLDKPFIVNASWLTPIEKKFDPAAGTWSFSIQHSVVNYSGNGTFTIEGADTDHPRILVNGTEVLTHPYGGVTRSGTDGTIDLVPLETDECK